MSNLSEIAPTDMLLEPIRHTRGKRNALIGKGTVYAVVHVNPEGCPTQWGNGYSHPSLTLYVEQEQEWNDGHKSDTTLCSIVFQRNRMDIASDEDNRYNRKVGGMLGGTNGKVWSQSYAGKIEAQLDKLSYLTVGLGIMERADQVMSYSYGDDHGKGEGYKVRQGLGGCDLSILIAGLLRVGVKVLVKRGQEILAHNVDSAVYLLETRADEVQLESVA